MPWLWARHCSTGKPTAGLGAGNQQLLAVPAGYSHEPFSILLRPHGAVSGLGSTHSGRHYNRERACVPCLDRAVLMPDIVAPPYGLGGLLVAGVELRVANAPAAPARIPTCDEFPARRRAAALVLHC